MTTNNHEKFTNSRQCDFCYEQKSQTYSLYKIVLKTDKSFYEIGMQTLLEKLNEWTIRQMLHLSGSQIVLLRPDLLHLFFTEQHPNEVVRGWMFKEHVVCFQCYEQYKEKIPVR